MMTGVKKALYFPIASYFKFFAKIRLSRWKPRIIVITGSSGKTTTLHLVEAQLKDKVRYSHHANSAYGIPFDILDLHRKTLKFSEWFKIVFSAPLHAFKKPYKETIYIVEADCDRPGEGKFLAELLNPEVTIWLSSARTHSMYFDTLIETNEFKNVEDAIAYEFGWFIEKTSKLVIINGDNKLITSQLSRTSVSVNKIFHRDLQKYTVNEKGSTFKIHNKTYSFSYLIPEEAYYSIQSVLIIAEYLDYSFDHSFESFYLPPGRSSLFKGLKHTLLIDSTYNSNLSSVAAILSMFSKIPGEHKWVVLGDMPEQGVVSQTEHENLAKILLQMKLDGVILKGKLVEQYTLPILEKEGVKVVSFLDLKGPYEYLIKNLENGGIVVFKGGQSMMLEGIIEKMLINKEDIHMLPRREKIWNSRRAKQGI